VCGVKGWKGEGDFWARAISFFATQIDEVVDMTLWWWRGKEPSASLSHV
jgi:hypothetical protein